MKNWKFWLEKEFKKDYFQKLKKFVDASYNSRKCFPSKNSIFRAFELTDKQKVKVVILGQDPYPQPGVANGLAFSVNKNQKLPQSLQNILKEVKNSYPDIVLNTGDLTQWAEQGVFLLNAVLTVEALQPNSHRNIGWEEFTGRVIKEISDTSDFVVFVLWGQNAQLQKVHINTMKHVILETSHPSSFSAKISFFGSKIFYNINEIMRQKNISAIDWSLRE